MNATGVYTAANHVERLLDFFVGLLDDILEIERFLIVLSGYRIFEQLIFDKQKLIFHKC